MPLLGTARRRGSPFPNCLVDTSTTRSTVGRGRSHPRPTAGEALTSTGPQAGGASRSFYGTSETPASRGAKNRSGLGAHGEAGRDGAVSGRLGDGYHRFRSRPPGATPTVPIVAEDFGLGELADRSRAEEIRLFTALVIAAARTSGRLTDATHYRRHLGRYPFEAAAVRMSVGGWPVTVGRGNWGISPVGNLCVSYVPAGPMPTVRRPVRVGSGVPPLWHRARSCESAPVRRACSRLESCGVFA